MSPLRLFYKRAKPAVARRVKPADPCAPQALKRQAYSLVLLSDPLTILSSHYPGRPLGAPSSLGPSDADRPVLFLIGPTWQIENRTRARELATLKRRYERRYCKHRILLLGNSPADVAAMSRFSN